MVLNGLPIPADAEKTVTRFKLGFGGEVELLPATLSYVPNRVLRLGVDVAAFHAMLEATARRQGFETNSIDYFLNLFDALEPDGQCVLFLAESNGVAVSALLLIIFGDSVVYKRGAWSGRDGNLHPNEFLHWSAMLWAKERGCKRYDFDGIDPDAYDVFVVKSRVHFRRGFDETGYAKTILVVDAPGPWVGTTRLDALDYQHAPLDQLYPFGVPPPEEDE